MSALAKKSLNTVDTSHKDELLAIIKERSFKIGNFMLASGRQSNMYFNMKPTMMHPQGAYLCAVELMALIEEKKIGADYVGGLEMGAVPIVSSLASISYQLGNPITTFFVRKAAKEHGAKLKIEGFTTDGELEGRTVLVVDDVTTTGGSICQAIDIARAEGAIVKHAATLVDRSEGAVELLKDKGITLHSLYSARDFIG